MQPGRRVLLPGCGSAYEAGFLDGRGFEVTAIDIAPAALARARAVLGEPLASRVLRQADFFTLELAVDWIYERALLCALPLRLWADYAAAAARLLRPGALLAGFFFVDEAVEARRRGPPFAARAAELDELLGAGFECIDRAEVAPAESIAVFAGREHWMVWRRRPADA
jgi:SAM-dependent methyltransferase